MLRLPLTLAMVTGCLCACAGGAHQAVIGEISRQNLDESLVAAAGNDDRHSYDLVMGLGATIHGVDRHGGNAVLTATVGGHSELLRSLIEQGVEPNARGGSGFTALTHASLAGSLRRVQLLLKAGADPNLPTALGERGARHGARIGEYSALHLARAMGYSRVVAALARRGASDKRAAAASEPMNPPSRMSACPAMDDAA